MTWQKGQSGNPQGRRKGVIEIATILKKQVIEAGLRGKAAELCKEWLESGDLKKCQMAMDFIAKLTPKDITMTGEMDINRGLQEHELALFQEIKDRLKGKAVE